MRSASREWALRSTRVVTPEGERPAVVAVRDGTISAVPPYDAQLGPEPTPPRSSISVP